MAIHYYTGFPGLGMTFTSMRTEWYEFGYSEGLQGRVIDLDANVAPEYAKAFYEGILAGLAIFFEPEEH